MKDKNLFNPLTDRTPADAVPDSQIADLKAWAVVVRRMLTESDDGSISRHVNRVLLYGTDHSSPYAVTHDDRHLWSTGAQVLRDKIADAILDRKDLREAVGGLFPIHLAARDLAWTQVAVMLGLDCDCDLTPGYRLMDAGLVPIYADTMVHLVAGAEPHIVCSLALEPLSAE